MQRNLPSLDLLEHFDVLALLHRLALVDKLFQQEYLPGPDSSELSGRLFRDRGLLSIFSSSAMKGSCRQRSQQIDVVAFVEGWRTYHTATNKRAYLLRINLRARQRAKCEEE